MKTITLNIAKKLVAAAGVLFFIYVFVSLVAKALNSPNLF